jgi:hypothetical protein
MYELKFVWQHSTLIIASLIARRRQSIADSLQKLPDSVVKPVSRARHKVDVSGETITLSISLSLTVDFCIYRTKKINKRWYLILYLTYCGHVGVPQEVL